MKRVCSLVLALCVAAFLAACSQGAASSSGSTAPSSAAPSSSVSQASSDSVSASSSESVSLPDSSVPTSASVSGTGTQDNGASSQQEEGVLRGTLAAEAMSTITIRAEDGSEYTFLKDDIQEMDEVYEGDSVVCTYTGELGPEAVLTSVKLAS